MNMILPSEIPPSHYYKHPFVIWILDPIDRIMTIRPSWDLKRALILDREFPDEYYGGRLYPIARHLRHFGFYPADQKIMPAVRRVWSYYMQGHYMYPGLNVVIDPWYYEGDECIELNFLTGDLYTDLDKQKYWRAKK